MIAKTKKQSPPFLQTEKSNDPLSKSYIANIFSRRNSKKTEKRHSISTNRSLIETRPRSTLKTNSNRHNCTMISDELRKINNKTSITVAQDFLNLSQSKIERPQDNCLKTENKEIIIQNLENKTLIFEPEKVKSKSEYFEIQELKRQLHFQEIKAFNLLTETNRLRNENSDFETAFNEIRSQKESLARKIEEDFFSNKMQQIEISKLKSELSHQNLQINFLKNTLDEERKNNTQLKLEFREIEIENELIKSQLNNKNLESASFAEELKESKKEIAKLKINQKNKFVALMKKPNDHLFN